MSEETKDTQPSADASRVPLDCIVMPYQAERNEGRNCENFKCRFYDDTETYEQNCQAGDEDGNPYLPVCEKYIPEHDGA